jgi:hypothetical protein
MSVAHCSLPVEAGGDAFATLSDRECETLVGLLKRVQAQLHVLSQEAVPDGSERRAKYRE